MFQVFAFVSITEGNFPHLKIRIDALLYIFQYFGPFPSLHYCIIIAYLLNLFPLLDFETLRAGPIFCSVYCYKGIY